MSHASARLDAERGAHDRQAPLAIESLSVFKRLSNSSVPRSLQIEPDKLMPSPLLLFSLEDERTKRALGGELVSVLVVGHREDDVGRVQTGEKQLLTIEMG